MNLSVLTFNSQRVLTTAQLAESYGATSEKISYNFNYNKSRYKEGKHFNALTGEEKRDFINHHEIQDGSKNAQTLYLWTEKGAWLHAKSLNTDQAWDAYEMLVDEYYKIQNQVKILTEQEQLEASLKLTLMNSSDVKELKVEVTEIRSMVENQITLDHGEQRGLQRAISRKVFECAKSDEHKRLLYPELHREIKDRFGVTSYKDVKRQDLTAAIGYVNAWLPRKVS